MDVNDFTPFHVRTDVEYDTPEMTAAMRRIMCRCIDANGWDEPFFVGDFDTEEEKNGFQVLLDAGFLKADEKSKEGFYSVDASLVNKFYECREVKVTPVETLEDEQNKEVIFRKLVDKKIISVIGDYFNNSLFNPTIVLDDGTKLIFTPFKSGVVMMVEASK